MSETVTTYLSNGGEGSIEVISGCMFSGKTEELFRRLRRVNIAGQKYQLFKPDLDKRYGGENKAVSHLGNEVEATPINSEQPEKILREIEDDTQVVAIDEAQFFSASIVGVIKFLADHGIRVIVAGLDLDFRGNPFGSMPTILAIGEKVDKLTAICEFCKKDATKSLRLTEKGDGDSIVLVAGADKYKAVCRKHHTQQER